MPIHKGLPQPEVVFPAAHATASHEGTGTRPTATARRRLTRWTGDLPAGNLEEGV